METKKESSPAFFTPIKVAYTDNKLHVYLAGPDVFKPNPKDIGEVKKRIVNEAGHIGHFPMDPELDGFSRTPDTAFKIGKANEGLMKISQVILVNMTPWRGSSMDVGTAFEVGYMSCRYDLDPKQEVLIIGYYAGEFEHNFAKRVAAIACKGAVTIDEFGTTRDSEGNALEDFGLCENLMIPSAINKTGGAIFLSFKEAVENIKPLWDKRHVLSTDYAPMW